MPLYAVACLLDALGGIVLLRRPAGSLVPGGWAFGSARGQPGPLLGRQSIPATELLLNRPLDARPDLLLPENRRLPVHAGRGLVGPV